MFVCLFLDFLYANPSGLNLLSYLSLLDLFLFYFGCFLEVSSTQRTINKGQECFLEDFECTKNHQNHQQTLNPSTAYRQPTWKPSRAPPCLASQVSQPRLSSVSLWAWFGVLAAAVRFKDISLCCWAYELVVFGIALLEVMCFLRFLSKVCFEAF